MNDESLDVLLNTPLRLVDDAGFSDSVMARVHSALHPLALLEIALLAISAVLALMFLPVRAVTDVAMHLSSQLADSTAAAMGCLAIVVSIYLLRKFEAD